MSDSLRDQLLKAGFAAPPKPEPAPKRPQEQQRTRPSPQHQQAQRQQPQQPQQRQRQRPPHNMPSGQPRDPSGVRPPARDRSDIDLAKAYALRDKTERETREAEQREAERRARERKERKQKLVNALGGKALNDVSAEIPRHFPHTNKIRRIYVTAEQLPRLNGGELAVVQLAGRYLLVTREAALAAQAIDGDALVLLCDPQAAVEDDIPPDLVW
jgi:uncharacterized protein YaiL (DUF2058 family)